MIPRLKAKDSETTSKIVLSLNRRLKILFDKPFPITLLSGLVARFRKRAMAKVQSTINLDPTFVKHCGKLVEKILETVPIKTVNNTALTAEMFMGLVLEYNQSLNDKEPLEVLASLERVLLDEARSYSEAIFENFSSKLAEKLDPALMPMNENELAQIADQCKTEATAELLTKLRDLCSAADLTENYNSFEARLKSEIDKTIETNTNYSEEKSREVLQVLLEKIRLPKVQSTEDVKPTLAAEYMGEWVRIIEEYFNHTKGPAKNTVLINFIKSKVLGSIGEILKDVVDAYAESENKLRLYLTELQVSEKKWKTLFENNEKILAERSQEKDELMAKNNEFELKFDQLQRDLRTRENDIKSLKKYQEIEIANLRQQDETLINEKVLVIEDLKKKLEALNNKIAELEAENQKLQNENIRNAAQLKNNNKILEQTLDETKKKPKTSQQQNIISTLYKNIKASLEEFKVLLNELNDAGRLKKQVLDLQKEANEQEFATSKRVLEVRKEMGTNITDLKVKHEQEIRTLIAEIDSLKQNNFSLKTKLVQADNKYKVLISKLEGLQSEKELLEDNMGIKEKVIEQCKQELGQERMKIDDEVKKREAVEMILNTTKIEYAEAQEDVEALVDFIDDIVNIMGKKRINLKEMIGKLTREKLKRILAERFDEELS
eukprot:TRINITY_DN3068_c0_g1_i4.p1 TRINITY_DN3068_c0_g1~~TRINITY_DN3068_c0_g1_i4.p1  ORF type:complete len:663 (+),score=265.40 TRINITY_DN3068_c0_g1_i4:691-2679(+)